VSSPVPELKFTKVKVELPGEENKSEPAAPEPPTEEDETVLAKLLEELKVD